MTIRSLAIAALLLSSTGCGFLNKSSDDDDDDNEEWGEGGGSESPWGTSSGSASGASSSGASSSGGEETGSEETGGEEGGEESGGEDGDDHWLTDSCTINVDICVYAAEPDNEAWCNGLPEAYNAVYSTDPCPLEDATAICSDMLGIGDYTNDGATNWFYGIDGRSICDSFGGSYAAMDGSEEGGEEWGGEETGGEETGADDVEYRDVSCSFSADICVEPNEEDNEEWCWGLGGTPSSDGCPEDDRTGYCDIPAGGDYSADAVMYYFGEVEGESICTDAGGTYTHVGSEEGSDFCDGDYLGDGTGWVASGTTAEYSDDWSGGCDSGGARDRAFLWEPPYTGYWNISIAESTFDPVIRLFRRYEGEYGYYCGEEEMECDRGYEGSSYSASITDYLRSDRDYYIVIDGYRSSDSGYFQLRIQASEGGYTEGGEAEGGYTAE